jgi:hypothetical protein
VLRKTPARERAGVSLIQRTRNLLAADAEALDEVFVATFIFASEVVQQLTALCDHFQKTTAAVVVFFMGLEVFLRL